MDTKDILDKIKQEAESFEYGDLVIRFIVHQGKIVGAESVPNLCIKKWR